LFARRYGGIFVLRIEDTDAERSSSDMLEGILDGLRWLGLDWDEGPKIGGPYGPYFQSQRLDRHKAVAAQLVAQGSAYYCYCSAEELKAKREVAATHRAATGLGMNVGEWIYDRSCCKLTREEIARREQEQMPRVIRFKVPPGTMRFDDLVHGPIEFDGANIEDFVLVRSDGQPTYQLSVVSDDIDMAITHVVRGDDHISNTPKQLLLYQALGVPAPRFAHVPLILGSDKKRLSKRHGATSVMEYARQGFLPEAMLNFLALLGWSSGTNQEVFTREELIGLFALEGIGGGGAVFNPEKLDWFNQQHIARLPPDELARRIRPSFEAANLWSDTFLGDRHAWFFAVLELLKPRAKRLDGFVIQGRFFFVDRIEYDSAAVDRHLRAPGIPGHLLALDAALGALPTFDAAATEGALRSVADARGVKSATLIHACRVAVTGTAVSPGLFDVLALLGRDQVHQRIVSAVRL
jgi:glutamyl-tRNA synthetase